MFPQHRLRTGVRSFTRPQWPRRYLHKTRENRKANRGGRVICFHDVITIPSRCPTDIGSAARGHTIHRNRVEIKEYTNGGSAAICGRFTAHCPLGGSVDRRRAPPCLAAGGTSPLLPRRHHRRRRRTTPWEPAGPRRTALRSQIAIGGRAPVADLHVGTSACRPESSTSAALPSGYSQVNSFPAMPVEPFPQCGGGCGTPLSLWWRA